MILIIIKVFFNDLEMSDSVIVQIYKNQYSGKISMPLSNKGSHCFKINCTKNDTTILVQNFRAFDEAEPGDSIIKFNNSNKSMLIRGDSVYKFKTMDFIDTFKLRRTLGNNIKDWGADELDKWTKL
jgi:hypothetical protein